MKISALIVAHNEEEYIGAAIQSILDQTLKADEIVVIVHNSNDKTLEIAKSFSNKNIIVVDHKSPAGVPYARMKGFEIVTGEIVACLDGDAVAEKHWLKNITKPLANKKISIVGGMVVITNNFFGTITSYWQFVFLRKILHNKQNYFAWGSSFACRKADYLCVGGIEPIIALKEKLDLNFWAEDLYMSLALMEIGSIFFVTQAKSYTKLPEEKLSPFTAPLKEWYSDNRKLIKYFKNKNSS
jgi:glycosyltransferase involved in cell wall biosynthesis